MGKPGHSLPLWDLSKHPPKTREKTLIREPPTGFTKREAFKCKQGGGQVW